MSATRNRSTAYSIAFSMCVAQFMLAMLLARQSCDWSLPTYVIGGVVVMGIMLMMPYMMRRAFPRHNRTPMALVFAMLGLVTWLVGLGISFGASGCGGG
jgi:hypothetical protein